VEARFRGSAGQSFGAFLAEGADFLLEGEANDYLGKGMGGGRIVVVPPAGDAGDPVLAGNTLLYGATGGEVFVAGRVGERFAVRNSGAVAVVEGAGDHACEYMTGGIVAIVGHVGMNLGAGMTGGEAFVHDPESRLQALVNHELVALARPDPGDAERLRALLRRHLDATSSPRMAGILEDWDRAAGAFWRVAPKPEVGDLTRKEEGTVGAKASRSS
jgi:glutamate synthase domain-containing protein 3